MAGGEEPAFESRAVEEALGWRPFRPAKSEREKTISENARREIVRLKNGNTIYVMKNLPELTSDEALLLRSMLDEYRAAHPRNSGAAPKEVMKRHIRENVIVLEPDQQEYLNRIVGNICSPPGPLAELLDDPDLEEVAVIGTGRSRPVYVFDSAFGWLPTNLYFSSAEELRNIANAMASEIGRRVTFNQPCLNAMLAGGSRLNVVAEPASLNGPCVTIRKFRESPLTPTDLIGFGSCSAMQMALFWLAVQADCSIMVCGNTGSGKTTMLNSIFSFVPKSDRVILVEETPEIRVPHAHSARLTTAEGIGLGMQGLIVNTLRMRPDRVLVGEVRDAKELSAFMDTLLAGQGKGSYATFHAQSAEEAIARMRSLGAMEMDIACLDLIVVQKRWSTYEGGTKREERKVVEVCAPVRKKSALTLETIFSYDHESRGFKFHGGRSGIFGKISKAFLKDEKWAARELSRRAEFIEGLRGKPWGDFFEAVQAY